MQEGETCTCLNASARLYTVENRQAHLAKILFNLDKDYVWQY